MEFGAVTGTIIFLGVLAFMGYWSINIVRPTERALIERLGKYNRFAKPGLHIIIPFIEDLRKVNVTERMIDAQSQEIITSDNLNATVDAQVYFKINDSEDTVKRAEYAVNNYELQIVNLARTTLRNIIGGMSLKECNSDRNKINKALYETLETETSKWGISVVRTELKEIEPPQDVQETMNKIVKAENEKLAAKDFATATETRADGLKRAKIKEAEGIKESRVLTAEGKAKAVELENNAANKFFVGNAQKLKALEVVKDSLENNTKIVLPPGESLVNVIGDLAGTRDIAPLAKTIIGDKTEPGEDKAEVD